MGYFSDPLGKASLLTYWQTLAEFSYGVLLARSKRPTDLALAAAEDTGDDDVTVSSERPLPFTPKVHLKIVGLGSALKS